MKHLILLATLLSVLRTAGQNDLKAREILEQTSRNMQSFQTISASFSFTMENTKMNLREKNNGSLVLKGKKYQVKLPDLGMEIFCDGKTVWNFTKEANQVTISNAGEEGQGVIDPTAIFNVYQEGYDYKFIEDKTGNGKTISFIDLFPKDKGKEFTKITVGIDKSKKVVSSLVTHGKDGNLYGIIVADMKMNQPVADQEFVFNTSLHKDVELIDFR